MNTVPIGVEQMYHNGVDKKRSTIFYSSVNAFCQNF